MHVRVTSDCQKQSNGSAKSCFQSRFVHRLAVGAETETATFSDTRGCGSVEMVEAASTTFSEYLRGFAVLLPLPIPLRDLRDYGSPKGTPRGSPHHPVEDLVERLMSRAREFAGKEPQADDMTVVVVRVEG
jgi:hypothetical protein